MTEVPKNCRREPANPEHAWAMMWVYLCMVDRNLFKLKISAQIHAHNLQYILTPRTKI